ncbi:MAG: hypothetical protein ACE5HS_23520 [bacterium]
MQITEPSTMLTDYVLAIFAIILAARLWKRRQLNVQISVQFWSAAFAATALAALVGGTSHGFVLYLNEAAKVFIWKTTVQVIGLASFFMLAGTIVASTAGRVKHLLLTSAFLQLAVYAGWMVFHNEFKYVIFDYVPAMLAIILLQGYAFLKNRDKSAVWMVAGILISFAAAGVQLSGFAIHRHFNHNDLYHVIQMVGIYLLFRGASLLRDQ